MRASPPTVFSFPSCSRTRALLQVPTAAFVCWVFSAALVPSAGAQSLSETAPEYDVHTSAPGPWGTLDYYYFYLEAPEYVVSQFPMPSPVTRWVFDEDTFDTVPDRLKSAGVLQSTLDRIFSPRRMVKDARHVHLFPSKLDVEEMTFETRSKVYEELAKLPANEFHHSPIFFLTDTVNEWAEDSGLPARIVDKLNLLSYKSGDALVFSDVPYLISMAESDTEARTILRKLTRVRTVMATLRISKQEPIAPLLEYWSTGLGLRRKELEPILHAISRTKGVSSLDLLHLLPPLPRKLLYTYPDLSHAALGRLPDCHWTSLNFFNFQAQNYFLEPRLATTAVLDSFERVDPPYKYGDILMFITPSGLAVHSATFLADDLAYSKNGMTMMAPWVVMRMADLHKLYGVRPGGTRIQGFRHKTPETGSATVR